MGAIRHRGFIPWDDDLDIAVTRRDYMTIIERADSFYNCPFILGIDIFVLDNIPMGMKCNISKPLWDAMPDTMKSYERLVDKYKNHPHILFGCAGDFKQIIKLCDEFYGDEGIIAEYFRKYNRPMFIRNIS